MLTARYFPPVWQLSVVLVVMSGFLAEAQSPASASKRFDKDGLVFDYSPNWELNDQSNTDAQQLVLTEKTLDAQIMIIALRGSLPTGKEEEAKRAVVDPGINRLLQQYENAGIKVERAPVTAQVAATPAEGTQLRFTVDRQAGTTDIYWLVINKRLVQLYFIRPEKTSTQAAVCWELIRSSLGLAIKDKNSN